MKVLEIISPVLVMIILGILCRKWKLLNKNGIDNMKALVTNIMLPVMVCICIITHTIFFHNNRPGKPLPGHSSFLGLFWGSFFCGWDGGRDGRTAGGAAAWSCLVRSFRRVILSV